VVDLKKSLNELRDEAFVTATEHGFHDMTANFGELLMLVVSELSEALEADRLEKWAGSMFLEERGLDPVRYDLYIRGTVEEEIADAVIRLLDFAGVYGIDLDWHVAAKMAYNKTRPSKHGKKY
jgi:NTP pyrophosphatase (non-canonical NTP hydrolase)